jgi:hypothetical protein
MKSLLEQKLIQKTLDAKFAYSEIASAVIEDASIELKEKNGKNVCVYLAKPVVERLENTLSWLSMKKGDFFELAILEALEKADSIMDEYELIETLANQPILKLKRVNPLKEVQS